MKSFYVNVAPFNTKVLVHYGKGINKLIKNHNKKYKPKIELETNQKNVNGLTVTTKAKNGFAYCILLNSKRYDEGVLLHECFHALHGITEHAGLTLTDQSEEYYAYALQDLFNQIKKQLNKK